MLACRAIAGELNLVQDMVMLGNSARPGLSTTNFNTYIAGMSGDGKTVFATWYIWNLALFKGWKGGAAFLICPGATYENNPGWQRLFAANMVIRIDDPQYATAAAKKAVLDRILSTVQQNATNGVDTLIVVDDWLDYGLKLGQLVTTVRSARGTLMMLTQYVKDGDPIARKNSAITVFFNSMIDEVVDTKVPRHQQASIRMALHSVVTGNTAGTRLPDGTFRHFTAPGTTDGLQVLGRLDLRGIMAPEVPDQGLGRGGASVGNDDGEPTLDPCAVCGGESTTTYHDTDYCEDHVPNEDDDDGSDSDMDEDGDDDNDNGDLSEQLSDPPDHDPAAGDREMERRLRELKRPADEGIGDRDQQRARWSDGLATMVVRRAMSAAVMAVHLEMERRLRKLKRQADEDIDGRDQRAREVATTVVQRVMSDAVMSVLSIPIARTTGWFDKRYYVRLYEPPAQEVVSIII